MVRRRSPPSFSLPTALALSLYPSFLLAASSSLPQIDFNALGTVGVVGSFAGLQLYDPSLPSNTFSSTSSTLLSRIPGGPFTNVGITSSGGKISAICESPTGSVYVGGLFTSLGGQTASNIAEYDPTAGAFSALGTGLDGEVLALSCNGTTVYAGGNFTGPVGAAAGLYAGHVAEWNIASKSWSHLPFLGLNGPVSSITPSSDGKSIFFGGNFSTTFTNSSSNINATVVAFPSLASSLVPITLNGSQFSASPSSFLDGFGNPQNIFCPAAADGPGDSWLLTDGSQGLFNVELYRPLPVRGIRLGNTFYQGRGTANFSITSLPNNVVLELTYASDPTNPLSPLVTCSSNCPLAHDPTVLYQDFLFPNTTAMTGFQMTTLGWYGAGAGLHFMQLLSQGAYAYGLAEDNYSPCSVGIGATTASVVTTNGDWTRNESLASIPGTIQSVLVGHAFGQTNPSLAPNLTLLPYVVANGIYSVFFFTPGCVAQGTCGARASVSIVVTPTGIAPVTTVVDQTNQQGQSILIYQGPLTATNAPGGGIKVDIGFAAGSTPDQYNFYGIVVDHITLIAANTDGRTVGLKKGWGIFEYAVGGTGTFGDAVVAFASMNATATLANSTGVDNISFKLSAGARVYSVTSIGSGVNSTVFLGGNFTYTNGSLASTNVLSYTRSRVTVAPNGGLMGSVTSLLELNGTLYAAGPFTATLDGKVTGLAGAARWQYSVPGSIWQSLGAVPSLGGSIAELGAVNKGSSYSVVAVGGSGQGLGYFDPSTSTWNITERGLFIGNLTAFGAANPLSAVNGTSWFAGNIVSIAQMSAPGGAVLSTKSDGSADLSAFGFSLQQGNIPQSTIGSANQSVAKRSIYHEVVGKMLARSGRLLATTATLVNTTLPSALSTASSSEVLAGAFWKNGSLNFMLLGGKFVTSTGIANLGLYDTTQKTLTAVVGEAITGAVTTLAVFTNTAWIGGNFTTSSGRQGFSTYDLMNTKTDDSQPGLQGYAGSNASVNAILQRPGYPSTIIVAGGFASAGSLQCQSICSWDTTTLQWTALNSGLVGVVGSIAFAGTNSEYLIAAGSFTLAGVPSYVAQWSFDNSTWLSIGSPTAIPGPATAVSADNGVDTKIFAAGTSLLGSPYLLYWNGTLWSDVNNGTLQTGSGVEQIVFVPLVKDHSANSIIESNRMLLVSGDLTINQTSLASALFDGESWHPYLVAASSAGGSGVVSQFFYSMTNFKLSAGHYLSVGIVILISIAIGLGLVFLLVLIGLLIALKRRQDEPAYPVQPKDDTDSLHATRRPTSLLATVGAATAVLLDGKGEKRVDHDSVATPLSFDGTDSYDQHFSGDAAARARFSFTGEHPGELSVRAGEDVTILDASDSNWWLVSRNASGTRGLVPSAYLA